MDHDKPITIAAAVALSCIGVFGLIPQPLIVGALQDVLGFSSQQAGLISAAEVFGAALASIFAAFWIQRVNWRVAAMFAIAVVVGGNLLSGVQTSYGALLALRGAVGFLGEGTAFVIAISVISNTRETDRNFAFSIAAQVAFGVVAFASLPFAVASYGLAGIFLPLAGVAILIAPLLRWLPAHSSRQATGGANSSSVSLAPAIIALGILLIWCIGLGGIYAFEERIGVAGGLEATTVGSALAVAVAIGFLGALAASWVADRWGRIPPVSVALLAQVGAIALLQGDLSWTQFAITASVFHFFWNFTGPYLMGMVATSDPTGRIAVLMPAAQTGGFAVGTALAGNLMTGGSITAANAVAIGGCLIALVIFIPTAMAAARRKDSAPASA